MRALSDIPIKRKVTLVILAACVVTLLLSSTAVFMLQFFHTRQAIRRELLTQAEIISANSTAALTFNDAKAASEILGALKAQPSILCAALFQATGERLAVFGSIAELRRLPASAPPEGFHEEGPHLVLQEPVLLDKQPIGTLYLRYDFKAIHWEFTRSYLLTLGLILPASLLLALLLSSSLQRVISLPILELARTAKGVGEAQDYSLRARPMGRDELGELTDAFNQMLTRIQEQDRALRASERRYRVLFESNPCPLYVCELESLRFLAVNDAAVEHYGFSREELLEMSLKELRSQDQALSLEQEGPNNEVLLHKAGQWQQRTKTGRLLDMELTSHALHFAGQEARLVLAVDITESKRAEAALRHRLKLEKLLSELSGQFLNLAPEQLDEGISRALELIGEFEGAELVVVYQLCDKGLLARRTGLWQSAARALAEPLPAQFDCSALPWWSQRIQGRETVHVSCLAQLPPEAAAEQRLLQRLQLHSLVGVPMVFSGRPLGFLGLAVGQEKKTWAQDDLTMLGLAAQLLVTALERKRASQELGQMHERLLLASHRAGMAEVATGVLHNVGNVLNSVNVSTSLIRETLRRSEVKTLSKVSALLQEHEADLGSYLTNDAKGKLVPHFIIKLTRQLEWEQERLAKEQEQLARNIEHIKQIVAMQQGYARVSDFRTELCLAELANDALQMSQAGLSQHGVQVERLFEPIPPLLLDKHKLLQILINLVANAQQALEAGGRPDKRLTLSIDSKQPERVQLRVSDNGIGIPAENLTRIFSHGFTTRQNGHGFGLHSGAIAAKEIGGTLTVASPGPGQGATFTLELPLVARASPSQGLPAA